MKKTIVSVIIFSIIVLFTYSCTEVEANFTYSPTQPKAGERVSFTNTSTDGEKWEWSFGDGGTSTNENTSHIYKRAGTYTVRLRVDGKEKYTYMQRIQVADTVPTIVRDSETVNYYQEVTYSALVYNPNGLAVSYKWTFSDNAKSDSIINGEAVSSTVKAVFTGKEKQEIVDLQLTVGETVFNVSDTVFVNDIELRSLYYAQKAGNIFRQRILNVANEVEMPINTGVSSGKHPFNIILSNDNLYIFDVGSEATYSSGWGSSVAGDGNIRVMDIKTKAVAEIINNNGASSQYGFFGGFVDKDIVYWTDYSDFVYKTSTATRGATFAHSDAASTSPYYLTDVSKLGLTAGNFNGGIRLYDNTYFWAKGGTSGKGISKFRLSSDGQATKETDILTDYAIRAFAIDEIYQRIYFSVTAPAEKIGLWTSNFNGGNAIRIDDSPMGSLEMYISGIVVDNLSRKVYWTYRSPEKEGFSPPSEGTWTKYYEEYPTHRTGIKQSELITFGNAQANAVEYFVLNVEAYGLALDNVARKTN